jgi:hypothetical protein
MCRSVLQPGQTLFAEPFGKLSGAKEIGGETVAQFAFSGEGQMLESGKVSGAGREVRRLGEARAADWELSPLRREFHQSRKLRRTSKFRRSVHVLSSLLR